MSDLQFLKVLNISNNKFKALPADVCYLANLEVILVTRYAIFYCKYFVGTVC